MENLDQILSHEYSPSHQCHLGDENYDKSTNQNFLMMSHQNPQATFEVSPKQNMFFFSLNSPLQNYDKFQFSHSYDRQDKHIYKQISRKISFEEEHSYDIKQQNLSSQIEIQQQARPAPRISKRNAKGLKNLSIKVFQIVSQRGVSSYLEVADRLVDELGANNLAFQQNIAIKKDQHNIKRRVYDALNVLISAQLLRKQGKQVICNYHFQSGQNRILVNLRAQRDKTKSQIRKKKVMIQEKRGKLKVLQTKRQAIRRVLQRNKQIQAYLRDQQKIKIPFVATKVVTSSILNLVHNSKETKININQNFQVFGDADILLEVQSFMRKQDQDLTKIQYQSTHIPK